MEGFKVRLDVACSSLIQLKTSLLMAVGLDPMDFKRSLPIPTFLRLSDPAPNAHGGKAMPRGVELPGPTPFPKAGSSPALQENPSSILR